MRAVFTKCKRKSLTNLYSQQTPWSGEKLRWSSEQVAWVQSQLVSWITLIYYGLPRGDAASKQIKITHLRVFLGKTQINPRNVTVGLIKLEANKQSQHDPHEANNFYCVFSPNKANGGIYWTFSIIVQWGKLLVNLFKPSRSTFRCKSASRPWFEFRACFSCVWIFRRASISDQILRGVERQGYSDLNHQAVQVM